jgi:hypothetical protein
MESAGARYTPGIDPNAPNLPNLPLLRAINYIACGPELAEEVNGFVTQLFDRWNRAKIFCENPRELQTLVEQISAQVAVLVPNIRDGNAQALNHFISSLNTLSSALTIELEKLRKLEDETVEQVRAKEKGLTSTEVRYSAEVIAARGKINDISETLSIVNIAIDNYTDTNGQLITNSIALLCGKWGTGKTHLLCDVTRLRIEAERPVLLVLAKNFQGNANTLGSIANAMGGSDNIREVISSLDCLGAALNERALILVDGVNEGSRKAWVSAIDELVALVEQRQNVGLLVSCRSPFENIALSTSFLGKAVHREHRGFDEQEFDAQVEFFRYYKVPLPEVPLLSDEFSRPLTLKLICEAFCNLRTIKRKAGFAGLASGQKGMTYVLESFVNSVGQQIEHEYGLSSKSVWILLKGKNIGVNAARPAFASHMAQTLKEYVGRRTALAIIKAHFPQLTSQQRIKLLESLRANGLLDEDLIWTRSGKVSKYKTVYRLPYQRFSDHLIARHLLDMHLDKTNCVSIAQSFSGRSPLSRVFWAKSKWHGFAKPGWAEALIAEFPESTKRVISDDTKRELYFYLPKRSKNLHHYTKTFLSGLFWRSPEAFSKSADQIINALLAQKNDSTWQSVVDALVAMAIKPNHPYTADRLYRYLATLSMADRDLHWGEYIRLPYVATSMRRLSRWMEKVEHAIDSADVAKQLIVLSSLLLSTVDRRERDLATHALVVIGEVHPGHLFRQTIASLSFNDPYVPERMLAAAYGVALSQWKVKGNTDFHADYGKFAHTVYELIFAPSAPHATHHVLARDYALGIIQLALRLDSYLLTAIEKKHLEPPYANISTIFPNADQITDAECGDGEAAIRMDFGNYTIGQLIVDRQNYDEAHPDYVRVRRQIEWRIGSLGYNNERFSTIDRIIGNTSYRSRQEDGEKVDRYGKKYSWIAYFEMYGWLEAQRKLKAWRLDERASDCDIDPSFPKTPRTTGIESPKWLQDKGLSDEEWLSKGPTPNYQHLLRLTELNDEQGRWVLLDGFISQENALGTREVFTFLRGLLLKPRDAGTLRDKYFSTAYPGNMQIPESGSDTYVYGGEIGLPERYCRQLIGRDGKYKRIVEQAFSRTESIEISTSDATELELKQYRASRALEELRGNFNDGGSLLRANDYTATKVPNQITVYRNVPGVKVELTTRQFGWESYHSKLNYVSGFRVPSPRIIQQLQLHLQGRAVDFYDEAGLLATQYIEVGEGHRGNQHSLIYVREDLLRNYLLKTRQTLVWLMWGERGCVDKDNLYEPDTPLAQIFHTYQHIHKRFATYREL